MSSSVNTSYGVSGYTYIPAPNKNKDDNSKIITFTLQIDTAWEYKVDGVEFRLAGTIIIKDENPDNDKALIEFYKDGDRIEVVALKRGETFQLHDQDKIYIYEIKSVFGNSIELKGEIPKKKTLRIPVKTLANDYDPDIPERHSRENIAKLLRESELETRYKTFNSSGQAFYYRITRDGGIEEETICNLYPGDGTDTVTGEGYGQKWFKTFEDLINYKVSNGTATNLSEGIPDWISSGFDAAID